MSKLNKDVASKVQPGAGYAGGKPAVKAEAKKGKSGMKVVKAIGKIDGGDNAKHAGRANRTVTGGKGVHGMPLMSAAAGTGK